MYSMCVYMKLDYYYFVVDCICLEHFILWSDQSLKCVVVTEADDTLLLLVWRLSVVMHRSFSSSVGSH